MSRMFTATAPRGIKGTNGVLNVSGTFVSLNEIKINHRRSGTVRKNVEYERDDEHEATKRDRHVHWPLGAH